MNLRIGNVVLDTERVLAMEIVDEEFLKRLNMPAEILVYMEGGCTIRVQFESFEDRVHFVEMTNDAGDVKNWDDIKNT